jgi:hypothetical protein
MKPPWCTPTHKGFLTTENTIDHANLRDLNMTNEQNKESTLT